MDAEALHELTAAYVLDALDVGELEAFEEHIVTCERCREEIAELRIAAGALAFGVPSATPPPVLRGRILDAARAERANVIPLRPRWAAPVAALAAVAACAAIGLGAWNVALHDQLGHAQQGAALRRVALSGANGSLFTSGGSAALVLSDLAAAPVGRTYEAWVKHGDSVVPAGLFRGGNPTTIFTLTRPVPSGAVVAVTVEPAGGTAAPTLKPFIVSATV
jgi:anti-sigma-K factor RskA